MPAEPPDYDSPDRMSDRRRERYDRRRGQALGLAYVVVLAVVLGAALGCPDDQTTASSTTTTSIGGVTTTSIDGEATSTTVAPGPLTYTAQLSGDKQVPPVETSASGTLTLTIADDGSKVDFVLTVTDLVGVQIARLRAGKAGETGGAIITLYDGPKSDSFSGTLIDGSFTAADMEGPLKGKTIEDLVTQILAGSIYFNVGTLEHSSGEIRGQLE